MKTKLSPLEELRLEKAKLIDECEKEKEILLYNWDYTKHNMGKLFLNSIFSTTKESFWGITSALTGKSNEKSVSKKGSTSNITQMVMSVAPLAWDLLQPMILSYTIKKVKSIFTKKRRKETEKKKTKRTTTNL